MQLIKNSVDNLASLKSSVHQCQSHRYIVPSGPVAICGLKYFPVQTSRIYVSCIRPLRFLVTCFFHIVVSQVYTTDIIIASISDWSLSVAIIIIIHA